MKLTNQHVVLFLGALLILVGGTVTLALAGRDVGIIIALAGIIAVPVLSAFGVAVYQKLDQVRETSNGNLGKVLEMQQRTQDQLTALAMAITPATMPDSRVGEPGVRR